MLEIWPLKEEAFGLDLNDRSLKIVKLKKKSSGFSLVSYNEEKLPPGLVEDGVIKNEDELAKIIRTCCATAKGRKISTKYVVASLPEEKSFLQVIQMPKMTPEELKTAVPLEAENYIPMSISDVYLDFEVISPVKDYLNNSEVLIVATPKKIVDAYVSCFKKAGLIPFIFEAESQAISRALIKKEANSSMMILLDFGENNTDFIVFSGKSIRFTSSISISSQLLTETISKSLSVSMSQAEKLKIEYGAADKKNAQADRVAEVLAPILEDLATQIKKYMTFYRDHSSYEYLLPDGKTEKILLCGGGAELKGLAEFLSKKLDCPVEIANPLANFLSKKPKSKIKSGQISFVTAIGLALRPIDNFE
jgi:type IV pilus assembly protein PilM